jgi:hypothetical protein
LGAAGLSSTVIVISSNASPQVPPGTVQRKTFVPKANPITPVFASDALVNVPEPLITVQIPPVTAVADKLVVLEQMV